MKLLREFFRLSAAGRSAAARREAVCRTITVPAPLASAGNVVDLRRPPVEPQPPASTGQPAHYALAANH